MEGMTIKEIAEIAGVSAETVRRIGKELHPSKFASGKQTVFNEHQSIELMALIRKKGFIQPTQNVELPTQNVEVATIIREMIPAMAAAIATAVKTALQQPSVPAQARQGQLALPASTPNGEYYTIKAYGSLRGVHVNRTSAVMLGREAARLSRLRNIEIRKVPDEEYGEINSYHISVLKEVFTV